MPRLIVRATPTDGDSIVELNRPRITIGRSARSDLCISDPFASRLHAEVRRKGDSWWLHDAGSANGTLLNGARMGAAVLLKDRDLIRIGETAIEYNDRADTTALHKGTQILVSDSPTTSAPEATIPSAANNSRANLLSTITTTHQTMIGHHAAPAQAAQEDTLAIISRVSVTLLSSQSLEETLQQVLDHVFEALTADRGYVMLLEAPAPKAPAELMCKAMKTRSGATSPEVQLSRSITEQVLQQGVSVLTSDAQQDPRFQTHQSIMLGGVRSVMAVPIAVEGRVLGMIYVDSSFAISRFTERDLQLLTLIASVAAIRIENVRLLELQQEQQRIAHEMSVASEIQVRLHPSTPPAIAGYDLVGVSFPCYEVGGDYFDFLQRRDGRHVVALGDVSGKGISAALLMSSVHAAVRAQCTTNLAPHQIVSELNEYIYDNTPMNRYVTFFYSELDELTGELTYINGGHNAPLLVRNSGAVEQLDCGGFPVGIMPGGTYLEGHVHLAPGDVLVIYSDGVTESVNEQGDEFGEPLLLETIQRHRGRTAAGLRDRIDEALQKFVGRAKTVDDLTLVILKRLAQSNL
ncbi:MAG: SpoIIE family protein phosphatase [Acidobacteria bacterium]|nr:SpoIIE family protein phosphatase [Acidobacteriota bacterium]